MVPVTLRATRTLSVKMLICCVRDWQALGAQVICTAPEPVTGSCPEDRTGGSAHVIITWLLPRLQLLLLLLLASLYYAFVKHKDFGPPDPEGLGVSPSAVLLIFPPSRLGLPWSDLVDTEGAGAGTRRSAQPIPIVVQPGLRRLATEVFFAKLFFCA